jgi:ATP-binding cassette subfamily B protein
MRVIKAFVKEAYEMTKFSVANRHNYDKNMHVVKLFAIMMPLVTLISGLSIAIALGYGGRMTMRGEISLGSFVAFVQYIMMLIWPMMAFGWCINIVSQGMASLTRYEDMMATKALVQDRDDLKERDVVKGQLDIKNLNFAYKPEESLILKDLSVTIKPGQTIGILGRTGSGKTTLVNLLLRMFDPPKGTIFLDGIDILDLPLKRLRQSFGYVPQDNFLFSDKIEQNIAFALDEFESVKVTEAAQDACVHDNIIEFKEGYQTIIGERGVTLSGGQKQRVSIARALLSPGPILILDDAVSAVDTKTEEAILGMLREKRADQTLIMIAHRISTLQNADHIIIIDEGRIVEEGTHDDLVSAQGIYFEMVRQQQLEREIINEG